MREVRFLSLSSSDLVPPLSLQVIKSSNVVQLDVDTEGNYTVGPNQAHAAAIKENFYLGGMPGE